MKRIFLGLLGGILSIVLLISLVQAKEPIPEVEKTVYTGMPVTVDLSHESLTLTDDLAVAKAQAKAYPDSFEAQFLLAVAYSRTPYIEKGFYAFKKAKKLMKKSPDKYRNLDEKIAEYEEMLTYRMEDPLVLYRLAFIYYTKGYGIEKDYIQDSKQKPAFWYAKAEETLRRLIAVDPDDIWARNYLGFLLVDTGGETRLEEAMALWEESLAKNSANNPGAYMLLGEAWLKKGNLRKAVEFAAQGLEMRMLWEESESP